MQPIILFFYVDVDGLVQYPAGELGKHYEQKFKVLTAYLKNNFQDDIKKSPIIQKALVKHSYGGFTKSQLVNEVAEWGNKKSPVITFKEGLMKTTSGAVGHTPDSKGFEIDYEFAQVLEGILADPKRSSSDKLAALTKFYETVIHEITHVGDLKDGFKNAEEVGKDAMYDVYHKEETEVTEENEKKNIIRVQQIEDVDHGNEDI